MTITITETGLSHIFDVLRVDYAPEAMISEHPVELGAEVADHIQVRPLRFTVDAYVTETPTYRLGPGALDMARTFLESALGKLLTVAIDGEGTFSSYALEGFGHSRTSIGGRTFACRFKQVRIAASISVAIPARLPAPVAAAGAPTEAPLGQAATTPAPASLLSVAAGFLGL
jgi:hypothetical protein